jgi:hypothetical protein
MILSQSSQSSLVHAPELVPESLKKIDKTNKLADKIYEIQENLFDPVMRHEIYILGANVGVVVLLIIIIALFYYYRSEIGEVYGTNKNINNDSNVINTDIVPYNFLNLI